ncbi:hypothetical protein LCGC14_1555380, partial [marine sediment metagenome]
NRLSLNQEKHHKAMKEYTEAFQMQHKWNKTSTAHDILIGKRTDILEHKMRKVRQNGYRPSLHLNLLGTICAVNHNGEPCDLLFKN